MLLKKQFISAIGLLLFLFVLPVSADEARFRLMERRYTWNSDGSMDFRFRKELTLFTHTAMNGTYGETFITYNPAFQTLTINESYTRQANGNIVRSPENAFVEVLPSAAANAPAFNGLREMVVVHTGLELGATIYLDYTIHTKSGYMPFMEAAGVLQETSPVELSRLTVEMSGGTENLSVFVNQPRKYGRQTRKGNTVEWEFRNLPALSREPLGLSDNRSNVTFAVCSARPGQVAGILRERFAVQPSPVLRHLADSLTRSLQTDEEKVKAVNRFLVEGLSACGVSDVLAGYVRPRLPEDVYSSVYATRTERAAMAAALLRAAGLDAQVAAVYPNNLPENVRGLANVKDWCIVWKGTAGKESVCFPSSVSGVPSQDRTALDVILLSDGEEIPMPAWNAPKEHKTTVSADQAKSLGNLSVLTLQPLSREVEQWGMGRLASRRETPMELPGKLSLCDTYEINVDKAMRWQPGNNTFRIANDCGEVEQRVTETSAGLQVVRRLNINSQTIQPADYAKLRRLLVEWCDENHRVFVFERK